MRNSIGMSWGIALLMMFLGLCGAAGAADSAESTAGAVAEQVASELVVEQHLKRYTGAAIQVYAGRTDWPLNWRLACALLAAPDYAHTAKEPVFKDLLDSKLKLELAMTKAELEASGLTATRVKSKALMAEAAAKIPDARQHRLKAERALYESLTPAKLQDVVHVISLLDKATSKELTDVRAKMKEAVAEALKNDPASLKTLQSARAGADQAADDELKKARALATEAIQKALKGKAGNE